MERAQVIGFGVGNQNQVVGIPNDPLQAAVNRLEELLIRGMGDPKVADKENHTGGVCVMQFDPGLDFKHE